MQLAEFNFKSSEEESVGKSGQQPTKRSLERKKRTKIIFDKRSLRNEPCNCK